MVLVVPRAIHCGMLAALPILEVFAVRRSRHRAHWLEGDRTALARPGHVASHSARSAPNLDDTTPSHRVALGHGGRNSGGRLQLDRKLVRESDPGALSPPIIPFHPIRAAGRSHQGPFVKNQVPSVLVARRPRPQASPPRRRKREPPICSRSPPPLVVRNKVCSASDGTPTKGRTALQRLGPQRPVPGVRATTL